MLKVHKTYALNEANIDNIAAQTNEVCQSLKIPSDQRLRVRLLVEEVLFEWLEKSEEAVDVEFKSDTQFFKPTITVSYASPTARNPLKADEFGAYFKSVFEQMTFSPSYIYEKGRNVISIRMPKPKINPILKLVLVMAISLIIGFLGKLVLPQSLIAMVQEYLIGPTYEKFLDVLGCIAGPLIFFSVAWGIYGIGDTATLNKLGKGMILSFLRDVLISVVLCVVFFPVLGCVLSGGTVDFTQILSIYTMFLDMLPVTIIEPFASGNTIQIIVLAAIIGIAMLYMGKKTRAVATAVEQINLITSFLMEVISSLVPFFIALVLINMVWSDTLNTLTASWRFILVLIIALLLAMLVHLVITSLRNKVKITTLFNKTLPSYLVSLTTASSAAAFGELIKNCERKFGIDGSLTAFGVPLGIVMHKVASGINCILIAFYVAGMNHIECSISWIIMAVIISAITAIATPPIPGGAVIGYTMLFSQLGLPQEALAIALAIDVVTDFFITAADVFCLPMALTGVARRYGLLDVDRLRKEC